MSASEPPDRLAPERRVEPDAPLSAAPPPIAAARPDPAPEVPAPLAALADLQAPAPGARLTAALAATRSVEPRRPADTFAFTLVVSVIAATVAYSVLGGPRDDLAALPRAAFVSVIGLCGVAFAIALFLALVPARRQVLPRARLAGRVGVAGALTAALAHVVFAALAPADPVATAATGATALLRQIGACIALGATAAFVPATLALLMLRRTIGLGGVALGAAIGGAAGALGGLFLHVRCDIPGVLHAAVAHGPAILLPAAVLLAILRLALGRRAA